MDFIYTIILSCYFLYILPSAQPITDQCPSPESILPCICANRSEELQIWCTHSDLPRVVKGLERIGEHLKRPIDELIIENNYLPSLPGRMFQAVKVLRLMLRHNGLERVAVGWLGSQEMSLMEIFIVENELRSIPIDSVDNMEKLQAITIQSQTLRKLPNFSNLRNLKYINIQSLSLSDLDGRGFTNMPSLEKVYIKGSIHLNTIDANAFQNLPKLIKLEICNSSVTFVHMRAMSLLPELREISLEGNNITDAAMIGRATRDLPNLSIIHLDRNQIHTLNEASFVDLPMLKEITLTNNKIEEIVHGAFHRVPQLRKVDLNYNRVFRIHPESFLQMSGSGVEDISLIRNYIRHISELRALLDALPRLKFLDLSENFIEEIPRGALRGHPTLEHLHLDNNKIKIIEKEAFMAMPTLRELRLKNNSLSNMLDGPFWNLPALKGLDLSSNYFRHIEPRMLYNLPSLRRIDFSKNKLIMIDPITFLQTPHLEHINMSGNALVSIHPATFRNLMGLYELDLSHNRLVEFVPGLPRGVECLHMQRNQISSFPIPPSPDLDLPPLRILDISGNGIQRVPLGAMNMLPQLRRINIDKNGLRQIEESSFSGLNKLEYLSIANNQLLTINPNSFKSTLVLKHLNMHGNILEDINLSTFNDNLMLKYLDISKNRLKSIARGTLDRIMELEFFNISSNYLTELPQSLNGLSKLQVLDVSFNHIKNIPTKSLDNLVSLKELYMRRNKIFELREGAFKEDYALEVIDLESNEIEILYSGALRSLPNLHSVFLGRNHIIDIPDAAFSDLPQLRIVELQENRLQSISKHAFFKLPMLQYLNLSHNQLTTLDSSGLKNLRSLEVMDISFNRITRIGSASLENMEWLVELRMDGNKICSLTGSPFKKMPRLKVLSMKNNKIRIITEATVESLRSNIAIFDIDGNPLSCNCGLIWLKAWLQEATSLGPKCADGSLVRELRLSRSDCSQYDSRTIVDGCEYEQENALGLGTSQIFSPWMNKMKDHALMISDNNVNVAPSPEESEYFYDEYVDYPYNDTIIEGLHTPVNGQHNKSQNIYTAMKSNVSDYTPGDTPTIYAAINNMTQKPITNTGNSSNSGFTFFGVPIPGLNIGNFWGSGRKTERKSIEPGDYSSRNNYPHYQYDQPKFETGGFIPMLPNTNGGFNPITNPNMNYSLYQHSLEQVSVNHTVWPYKDSKIEPNKSKKEMIKTDIVKTNDKKKVNTNSVINNKTIESVEWKKSNSTKAKAEIEDPSSEIDSSVKLSDTYPWDIGSHINRYNKLPGDYFTLPESSFNSNSLVKNITVVGSATDENNELQPTLITTDSTDDMNIHSWMDTSTASYPTISLTGTTVSSTVMNSLSVTTTRPEIKQPNSPSALSALFAPSNNLTYNPTSNHSAKRPATITKVFSPYTEQLNNDTEVDKYLLVNNRGGKTSFRDNKLDPTPKHAAYNESMNWYFQNYNHPDLEPYIGPGVIRSNSAKLCDVKIFTYIMLSLSIYILL